MDSLTFDHARWLEIASGRTLNELQRKVATILGILAGGIYNAPIDWAAIEWEYGKRGTGMSVIWFDGHMATSDLCKLTWLVFMCCEARIRCQVAADHEHRLRLSFWQRSHEGGTNEMHPNLDEFVADFRAWLPHDHSIMYRPPAPAIEIIDWTEVVAWRESFDPLQEHTS